MGGLRTIACGEVTKGLTVDLVTTGSCTFGVLLALTAAKLVSGKFIIISLLLLLLLVDAGDDAAVEQVVCDPKEYRFIFSDNPKLSSDAYICLLFGSGESNEADTGSLIKFSFTLNVPCFASAAVCQDAFNSVAFGLAKIKVFLGGEEFFNSVLVSKFFKRSLTDRCGDASISIRLIIPSEAVAIVVVIVLPAAATSAAAALEAVEVVIGIRIVSSLMVVRQCSFKDGCASTIVETAASAAWKVSHGYATAASLSPLVSTATYRDRDGFGSYREKAIKPVVGGAFVAVGAF
jgi:hypothetical protein